MTKSLRKETFQLVQGKASTSFHSDSVTIIKVVAQRKGCAVTCSPTRDQLMSLGTETGEVAAYLGEVPSLYEVSRYVPRALAVHHSADIVPRHPRGSSSVHEIYRQKQGRESATSALDHMIRSRHHVIRS